MRWILAAILLIGSYSSSALACSCVGRHDPPSVRVSKAFEKADLVFVGRVESKEKIAGKGDDPDLEYERAQFYVLQSWKGEKANRVYVETEIACCTCRYEFAKGGTFLVYASGPNDHGYYTTGLCAGTKPLDAAMDDIAILDDIVAEKKK